MGLLSRYVSNSRIKARELNKESAANIARSFNRKFIEGLGEDVTRHERLAKEACERGDYDLQRENDKQAAMSRRAGYDAWVDSILR